MDFAEDEMGDVPTRPMRVRISYTVDSTKDNYSARIQDVMSIPVVPIDESNQVGVIELRHCIAAVTAASPELVSRLADGDFTVYAIDHSETDLPLVGQGALSALLNAAQPTQQSQSMITGRVCRNVLAMLKNGPKETLEVKLRLVPISRPVQADFARSMDSLRSASPAMSSGFDPNAWNASMQQNKLQQQANDYFNFDAARASDERDLKLVDDIFGLGSISGGNGSGQQVAGGAGVPETPTDPTIAFNPAFSHSAPGSRAGSPMMVSDSDTHNPALRHQSFSGHPSKFENPSRPGSRASVRSEVGPPRHQRQASTPSLPQQHPLQTETEVYYNEDGQSRKRAKVVQADWRGKSSFGSKSNDLRVNAATAASMHMHRPIPKRPTAPGSNLEPPPRVPTPVPQLNRMMSQRQSHPQQLNPRRSMLRQASTANSDFLSDIDSYSDAIMSSPEEDSPSNSANGEGTPQEIPSSPPVFSGINLPQPSSPGLPTLPPPRLADSGYMSERNTMSSNIMDSFMNDEDRSPDAQDYELASQYKARNDRQQSQPIVKIEGSETARPMPPLFDGSVQVDNRAMGFNDADDFALSQGRMEGDQGLARVSSVPAKRPAAFQATSPDFESSMQPASRASTVAQTPFDQTQSRRGSLALPPAAPAFSSDLPNAPRPAAKQRPPVQRSRTTFNESDFGSPAPSDTEGGKPKGPKRSGAGASRRKVIADKLMKDIETGQPINYCFHCGAIETPTWRRIYIKECDGTPTGLDSHEGEGETIGVEVLKDKETGVPLNKFLVRKSMKRTKENPIGEEFEPKQVCNPCGLWFNKFRTMRPEEKWNRKASTRNRKKQKDGGDAGPATDGPEPYSEAPFFTDQVGPDDDSTEENEMPIDPQLEGLIVDQRPAPSHKPRANSLQAQQHRPPAPQRSNTMAREIQSSPVRGFHGSQQSPIEIEDATPKPTRRLLFPSPRGAGQVKSLEDNRAVTVKAAVATGAEIETVEALVKTTVSLKPGLELAFDSACHSNIFEAFTFDKENVSPNLDFNEDDLAHLFEGSPNMVFKTPRKTPSAKNLTTPRSKKQLSHLLRTPTPASRKCIPLTPNANAGNAGLATVTQQPINDFMTSPSSSRYFLRSTPSRLERTPGRHSSSDDQRDISPWSRHLAQMLSDVNDGNGGTSVAMGLTSPSSRAFGDFPDMPTFMTPGRVGLEDCGWEGLEGLLGNYDASPSDAVDGDVGEGKEGE